MQSRLHAVYKGTHPHSTLQNLRGVMHPTCLLQLGVVISILALWCLIICSANITSQAMHLLYDLPTELQQAILAEAMHMHLHRAPQHKLIDDRRFCWLNSAKDLLIEQSEYISNSRLTVHEHRSRSFMLYVTGYYSSPSPPCTSGVCIVICHDRIECGDLIRDAWTKLERSDFWDCFSHEFGHGNFEHLDRIMYGNDMSK